MSQRWSEYKRQEGDLYETPEWVTKALIPHLPDNIVEIWEPACGSGKMVRVLETACQKVRASDIAMDFDFLKQTTGHTDWIITNPPYNLAQAFIEHALTLADNVAMLLRCDFDHAKTRQHLFGEGFAKKLVLTKRIRWFEGTKGSPSFNHAWFIWSHAHKGPPTLAYGP